MKNSKLILSIFIFILVMFNIYLSSAKTYEVNYTVNPSDSANPQFVIQALKYEPYPVSAGDWFDIWIKAQNIGSDSAKNVIFTLSPSYPFESSEDLVRNFGTIYGTWEAHAAKSSLGDASSQTNQVVMKFRVKVADNSPVGESMLKLKISTGTNANNLVAYNLPIVIGKTKTDFDIVMQDSTSGISLSVANTGENPATAVTVSIPKQEGLISSGTSSSIIGNLAGGDFTTVSFQASPSSRAKQITINVAYTDIAGIRNVIEKNLSLETDSAQLGGLNVSARACIRNYGGTNATAAKNYSWIGYILAGIILGTTATIFVKRKK